MKSKYQLGVMYPNHLIYGSAISFPVTYVEGKFRLPNLKALTVEKAIRYCAEFPFSSQVYISSETILPLMSSRECPKEFQ